MRWPAIGPRRCIGRLPVAVVFGHVLQPVLRAGRSRLFVKPRRARGRRNDPVAPDRGGVRPCAFAAGKGRAARLSGRGGTLGGV
ncbi:MAG TPA: hypothetical protein PLL33_15755, partial [Paracoccus sp. (in: a-proteobacteria)]|nr:hypothetical protein [Paracoccus sp. (in: a-proteobacteria)]